MVDGQTGVRGHAVLVVMVVQEPENVIVTRHNQT